MGWTCLHKDKGGSLKELFQKEFEGVEVLDVSTHGWNEVYMACKNKEGQVFGGVVLIQRKPNDHYNFCYKEMDESMHPFYYNCPERILDQLSPTDHEGSNEWRQKCREKIERKKNLPKLKHEDVIKLSKPLEFASGDVKDTFKVVKKGRSIRFVDPKCPQEFYDYGVFYKVDWKHQDFQVIGDVNVS